MIVLGDGDADVPTTSSEDGKISIDPLISDDRVDFVAPANCEENFQLDTIVKGILGRIARVA